MNRHETNKANMGSAVRALFSENQSVITDYPVFEEPVIRLSNVLIDIGKVDKKFITATGGKTTTKNNAEDDLLEDVMPVKSALYSFAGKTNNEPLKALTVDSEATLKKMRDADFLKKAESIKEEAEKKLTELAPYKITEAVLTELQEKIDAFRAALGGQDTGLSTRSALRKELDAKFDEMDKVFEDDLDHLIELVRKSNRLFYDKYIAARGIKDLGGGKKPGEDKPDNPTPTPPAQ